MFRHTAKLANLNGGDRALRLEQGRGPRAAARTSLGACCLGNIWEVATWENAFGKVPIIVRNIIE